MGVLSGLKPEKVFEYFEAISQIPRGSGNMEAISAYVLEEGQKMGLEGFRDDAYNVVLLSPATEGYEDAPAVMLQGHMDMVAEKTVDSLHDFLKDPLELFIDGDFIGAKGTTLGGDDGAAVCYMLAILSDSSIPHPALECVFTVDEEIGLIGAAALDFSFSKAKYLINLDSEEEGVFLVSCVGGVRYNAKFTIEREEASGTLSKVTVHSTIGGHSGAEIHKDRPNTNIVMANVLYDLKKEYPEMKIVSVNGGLMDNAIASHTEALIITDEEIDTESISEKYHNEYVTTDAELSVVSETVSETTENAFSEGFAKNLLFYMNQIPNGVQAYNHAIEGLVETSLNFGVLKTGEEEVLCTSSIRSAVASKKERLVSRLSDLTVMCGGCAETRGDYPGWEYKVDSPLRDLMADVWNEMYGNASIQAIHAGLECGLILNSLPGLDIVSMGPDMKDIHTPDERLSIASVERCYNYLLEVLKRIK